jgi:hypothetical protein
MKQDSQWKIAAWSYALAVTTFWAGVGMAMRLYPKGPYDWMYTVRFTLASRKYNPVGGTLVTRSHSGSSMLALWPVASYLRRTVGNRALAHPGPAAPASCSAWRSASSG